MRYSAKVLEQLLLKLQSLYYDRYKNCTIKDALTLLLNQETIADYNNIEWTKFKDDLIGFYPLPTARELRQDPFCKFDPQSKLEEFIKTIIPLEERVRVLTFLRDNADEVLFSDEDCTECHDFKKECARLICKCIEEGKRTKYHGICAEMAHPSLEAIANAKPLPSLSKEEQIIAENIPHYPHEEEGLFSYEVIFWVAKYFIEDFLSQSDTFNRTHEGSDKPCMSLQKYKDPIRDWLIRIANRYLYFDENPIYQVIWVMGVLIRLRPKQDWWTKNFADNIVNYLDCTKFLCDTKINMDNAIDQVKRLTELSLFDEPATQRPTKSKECAIHRDMNVKQIVDDLVTQIQQHHQDAKNVQVDMHFGNVGQVIGNVENYNYTKQDE